MACEESSSKYCREAMGLLNAGEAASYLHLNVKRIQALARSGALPGRRVGRKWLFDQRDLETATGAAASRRARVGEPVFAVIKSTEVMIGKGSTHA
jgi:excisionase family DNA binding protein